LVVTDLASVVPPAVTRIVTGVRGRLAARTVTVRFLPYAEAGLTVTANAGPAAAPVGATTLPATRAADTRAIFNFLTGPASPRRVAGTVPAGGRSVVQAR
jgi:hypothetical protein